MEEKTLVKDINEFVRVERLENGRVKITYDINNESNIYKYLHEIGFCRAKMNNKWVYYRRTEDNDIIPVTIFDIRSEFLNRLKNIEFANMTDEICKKVIDWFYKKNPIRQNGLFFHHIQDSLDGRDIHLISMIIDPVYKHRLEINKIISMLQENGFSHKLDQLGIFQRDTSIYYKEIEPNKYLVMNHYNSFCKETEVIDGFDCWLAEYENKVKFGAIKPVNLNTIVLSYKHDADFKLIVPYLK